MARLVQVFALVSTSAILIALQGCGGDGGGGGGGGSTSSPTTTTVITTTTTTVPPHPVPYNMKGICYGPIPTKVPTADPAQDVVQKGFQMQWGSNGRDDLGLIKALGGNTVRLYHDISLHTADQDHSSFLNYADSLGVKVLPGIDGDMCRDDDLHNDYDHYDKVKQAMLKSFKNGYAVGDHWHPAISIVMLSNEPDWLNPSCDYCRCKAVLSTMDAVLQAEKEAGIKGTVNLSVAWSFGVQTSIDGKVKGPGYFGFQDVAAITKNASLANYTPKSNQSELEEAFRTRWTHCLNSQAPTDYTIDTVEKVYDQFKPHPWFIGESAEGSQKGADITARLKASAKHADDDEYYLGVNFFEFHQSFWKGVNYELNYGMFSLGNEKIGQTGDVYDFKGVASKHPVYCLDSALNRTGTAPPINDDTDHRAEAVAAAWGGIVDHRGRCRNHTETVVKLNAESAQIVV